MRLIHFTASTVWRGHEQMIVDIAESLRDNGLVGEQLIICPKNSEICKTALKRGLNFIALDFKSEYDPACAKKVRNIADQYKADLIFLHSSKAHTLGVLAAIFFGLKVPLVLFRTMIKNIGTNFFRRFKYNHKSIKKIICISEPVAEILKLSVKDHSKLTVVGSVVDTDKFIYNTKNGFLHKELSIPWKYKIIGNISAFCKVKDHFTWVDTVEQLVNRGVAAKFVLIGEGPLEQDVKDYVLLKGLADEIYFTGFRDDIEKCLPEFDLFLFTSKNEATGGVVLESYACRVPVVAARAGGIPTILEDNETGLLADPGNPVDFADKVQALLYDDALQDKFTAKGFDFLMNTSTRLIIGTKIFNATAGLSLNNTLNNDL